MTDDIDYIASNRRSFINRGEVDSPANMARHFAKQDPENRAKILDAIDAGDSDEPIVMDDAKAFIERRSYVQTLRRTHAALRRQGR